MSTTTLTIQGDGDGAADKSASSRRRPRCCLSRRARALLVGAASVAVLLTSISATVFGIVAVPDTPPAPARPPVTLSGVDLRPLEVRKKSSSPGKNVGGILVEGGLRDPASGGGGNAPADPQVITEEEESPAVIVITSRGKGGGGTGGRLVGGAGGGQLFFNPAADSRPVYIIRPAAGAGTGSVIVTSPGDLLPVEATAEDGTDTDDGIIVDTDSKNSTAEDGNNADNNGLLNDVDDPDSANSTIATTAIPTTTEHSLLEPPPLSEHLWLRAERGPLAVALALQVVFLVLTVLMLHGLRKHREDLVLLWLVSAAFGLAVGSAGAVLSALSAFDAGTPGALLVGFAYLIGLTALWCGWAVVVAYHRQATPPEFDNSHPHFG